MLKNSGFSLVEVLIAAGLLGLSALALNSSISNIRKDLSKSEKITSINLVRMTVLSHFQNDYAWKTTLNELSNTNLDCLRTQTSCSNVATRPFKLFDAAGTLFYDSTNAASGFKIDGTTCNSYDDVIGSDTCPIRVDLSWQPECITPCIPSTLIRVTANFKYRPINPLLRINFPSSNYAISIARKGMGL